MLEKMGLESQLVNFIYFEAIPERSAVYVTCILTHKIEIA